MIGLMSPINVSSSVLVEQSAHNNTSGLPEEALLTSRKVEVEDWSQRIDDLLAIRNLAHDWDGQGAPGPALELVDSAISLAVHLRQRGVKPPDRAVAGVNGTVSLEWYDGSSVMEFEIHKPRLFDLYVTTSGRTTTRLGVAF
jgi:hypothetical protein